MPKIKGPAQHNPFIILALIGHFILVFILFFIFTIDAVILVLNKIKKPRKLPNHVKTEKGSWPSSLKNRELSIKATKIETDI